MAGKRHDQQEIEKKLQHAAKLLANGEPIAAIARKLEISKQTLFRWRREYGSLDDRLLAPRNRTRHSILDTAERLLAQEGMSVSLRRIMAEADVNIAAINYHRALDDHDVAHEDHALGLRAPTLHDRAEVRIPEREALARKEPAQDRVAVFRVVLRGVRTDRGHQ